MEISSFAASGGEERQIAGRDDPPLLRPGDVLLFDEFGVPTHEFRAFDDFVSAYRVDYELVGAVNNYLQVAIRLV